MWAMPTKTAPTPTLAPTPTPATKPGLGSCGGVSKEALLKLLDEKAQRNGQLRAAADERESQLSEQITLLEAELCEAHAATQAATEQVGALKRQVEEAKRAGEADEAAMASALATFTRQEAVRGPGKRGLARKGAQRAGLPTFKTASLNYESVPLFKRRGWSKIADIKRAIVALKTDKGGNITGDLHAASAYQARDAVTLFNMEGAPWQRGCLVSFLDYMKSQRFETTGAKDRKHWVCMKLWPDRFGTKEEYLQHRACMSKAGKFITSVGKLRALYECDLAEQLELQK